MWLADLGYIIFFLFTQRHNIINGTKVVSTTSSLMHLDCIRSEALTYVFLEFISMDFSLWS
jgi:hypothetical protein